MGAAYLPERFSHRRVALRRSALAALPSHRHRAAIGRRRPNLWLYPKYLRYIYVYIYNTVLTYIAIAYTRIPSYKHYFFSYLVLFLRVAISVRRAAPRRSTASKQQAASKYGAVRRGGAAMANTSKYEYEYEQRIEGCVLCTSTKRPLRPHWSSF